MSDDANELPELLAARAEISRLTTSLESAQREIAVLRNPTTRLDEGEHNKVFRMGHEAALSEVRPQLVKVERLESDLRIANGQLETLRADVARLTTERDAATKLAGIGAESLAGQLASMTTERDQLRTNLVTVTIERDTARTEMAAANQKLAGFDDRLRAELLKLGVRSNAITLPTGDVKEIANQTWTDRAKAAVQELQAQGKHHPGQPQP